MVFKLHSSKLKFKWGKFTVWCEFKSLNRKRIYKKRDGLEWVDTVWIENRDVAFVLYFKRNNLFLAIKILLIILVRLMSVHQIFEIIFCRQGNNSVSRTIKLDGFKLALFFYSDFHLLAGKRAIDFAVKWLRQWFGCEALLDS